MAKKDAVKLTDQAIEIHRVATALAREGNHRGAIAEWGKCLEIVETLAAEAPGDLTRQQNLMVVLHALADSLERVGKKVESEALRKRGFDILFRLDDAHRAVTRFSFANREIDIYLGGQKMDSRRLLRNIERVVREKTGIAQIAIDFGDVDLPETTVSFDSETGYRLSLAQREVYSGALEHTEAQMVTGIRAHSAQHGVRTGPPPIPRTEVSVRPNLDFDTRAHSYDALAHDGGYLLAFYREKQGGKAVLLRHVPPIGFVHYRFSSTRDYEDLQKDAASHCSAFLDLSYLGDEDISEDALRSFLREHSLYGWGSGVASKTPAPSTASPSGAAAPKPAGDSENSPGDEKPAFRIGGKELRVGQSLSPAEAEELIQAIISETPGPVTMVDTDSSTGLSARAVVNEWSDFTDGPRKNKEARDSQVADLQAKGYLAFRLGSTRNVELKTAYRALTPQYFQDFRRFQRCQEIPDRYFRPVSSAPTCFVSHRWGTLKHPDPTGFQFQILEHVVRPEGPRLIWYDFSCIPQEPLTSSERVLFRESVQNLNSLVIATDFLSIESDDYITRAWCYYEWVVSELLCSGKRSSIRPKDGNADYSGLVNELVLNGNIPKLNVTKNDDMPSIENLLVAGVGMFKTLAVGVTFKVLNTFGFDFGVGIASRFAGRIDFGNLWMIWQVLAGSSHHSGIRLPHLVNRKRLEDILKERHDRSGTHIRIFQELDSLSQRSLDLRILEQNSQEHLLSLLVQARRSGPIPAAFTTLALIKLVYSLVSTSDHGGP